MSPSHGTVVVAIDDDQHTVLDYAAAEALRTGARLRVVHVAPVPVATAGMVLGMELMRELRAAGRIVLENAERYLEKHEVSPEINYQLLDGPVLGTLLEEAEAALCLVLGADQQTWFDRLTQVGIAGHLARHASSPVVVVPGRSVPAISGGKVVIALDGESAATGPLAYAFARARERGVGLHVLHAARSGASGAEAETHRANIAEVLAGWSAENPDVKLLVEPVSDDTETACEKATEHAELLVLGQSHHAMPMFSHPVIAHVLRAAHCPVAVVPLAPVSARR